MLLFFKSCRKSEERRGEGERKGGEVRERGEEGRRGEGKERGMEERKGGEEGRRGREER